MARRARSRKTGNWRSKAADGWHAKISRPSSPESHGWRPVQTQVDPAQLQAHHSGMSAHETLVKEIPPPDRDSAGKVGGFFSGYWSRHYGAFGSEDWDEPPDLPVEQREEW